MQLLLELCQFPTVGLRILPIMSTVLDIGPFCAVMVICIVASANLYYAFGLYDELDSFIIIYRLAVLADFDLDEIEKRYGTNMHVVTGNHASNLNQVIMSTAGRTPHYVIVRVVLLLVSFTMTIFLMNLFIGVLTVSYTNCTSKATVSFSRFRMHRILEAQAKLAGWNALRNVMRLTGTKSISIKPSGLLPRSKSKEADGSGSGRLSVSAAPEGCEMEEANDMFMWVCLSENHFE